MLRYIIAGAGNMAVAVYSDMTPQEFVDHVSRNSKRLHPKGRDTIYYIGRIELVNPKVMSPDDFANFCPYLIGVK